MTTKLRGDDIFTGSLHRDGGGGVGTDMNVQVSVGDSSLPGGGGRLRLRDGGRLVAGVSAGQEGQRKISRPMARTVRRVWQRAGRGGKAEATGVSG